MGNTLYPELNGIKFVVYYHIYDGKFHICILDRNVTVENDGSPWYKAAYGNCLIHLQNTKVSDKLYLISEEKAKGLILNKDDVVGTIKELEKRAERVITRNNNI